MTITRSYTDNWIVQVTRHYKQSGHTTQVLYSFETRATARLFIKRSKIHNESYSDSCIVKYKTRQAKDIF